MENSKKKSQSSSSSMNSSSSNSKKRNRSSSSGTKQKKQQPGPSKRRRLEEAKGPDHCNCSYKNQKYVLVNHLKRITKCEDPHRYVALYNIETKYKAFVAIRYSLLEELRKANPELNMEEELAGTITERGIRLYTNDFANFLIARCGKNPAYDLSHEEGPPVETEIVGKDCTNCSWNGKRYLLRTQVKKCSGKDPSRENCELYEKETKKRAFLAVDISQKDELISANPMHASYLSKGGTFASYFVKPGDTPQRLVKLYTNHFCHWLSKYTPG